MRSPAKSLSIILTYFLTLFVLVVFAPRAFSQFYALEVRVSDTVAAVGQQDAVIPIYMKNWEDTIAAYDMTLTSDHPAVLQFLPLGVDTVGTLTSGWEYLTVSRANVNDLKIVAMANTIMPPVMHGIGYPQFGEIPLIKALARINDIPDTMTTLTIKISIIKNYYDFCFSDENGYSIGLHYDTAYDTGWYNCQEWYGEEGMDSVCLKWDRVPGPPADTMIIDVSYTNQYLDTLILRISDGSLTLTSCCRLIGDVDRNNNINILDVSYLVGYLYKGGLAPLCIAHADADCDCAINLLDVIPILNYLYHGSPPPSCICDQQKTKCGW